MRCNAQIILVIILLIGSVGLVIPANGALVTTINNISPFESPFGTVSVKARVADYSVTRLPVYYGTLPDNGRIEYENSSVEELQWNATSEEDAPEVAERVMELYGGIPPDAESNGASTQYVRGYNLSTNQYVSKDPLYTTISYSQKDVNGLWVLGDNNFLIIDLGDYGEPLWIHKIWRNYTPSGDVPVISFNAALEKFRKGELLNDPIITGNNITIDTASPAYYAKTLPNNDTILEPIWIFAGNTESGSRNGFYIYARQFANFTASPLAASAGDSIAFTDTSDASPTKWFWDFGDGTNSTSQNPAHSYTSGGNYTVNLTVWNDLGSDTISRIEYITVYPDPKPGAGFTMNYTWDNRIPPVAVCFNDTSGGSITNWSWDFGDGSNSTEQNPVHVFDIIPGDADDFYTVSLTVTDRYGRTSTNYDSVYIQMDYHPNFTAEPARGPAPLNVTFTDTSPPLTHIDALWWDFGDGNYYSWYDDGSGTMTPPLAVYHVYAQDGNYSVTLSIRPSNHMETSFSSTVDNAIHVGTLNPPEANFTANSTSGKVPLDVEFTDTSSGNPSVWNWSFGDGGYSELQNPVHTYSKPGTYTVALQVENPDGSGTESRPDYISVQSRILPVASFTSNITSGKVPLGIEFTDTSSGSPTGWSWTFGDGGVSTDQNPVHVFTTVGQYTVTLLVMNDDGSNATIKEQYVMVTEPVLPVASFTSNSTSGKAPLGVEFTDTSSGSPTGWSWSFGDGGISTDENPVHVYSTAGQFTITLQVTNDDGSNTTTKEQYISVGVPVPPVAGFTANRTYGPAPLPVSFTDESSGTPATWHWTFGDGGTSDEKNPSHIYAATGTYTVSLEVTGPDGSNTTMKQDYITVTSSIQPPIANFTGRPVCGKVPLTVNFNDTSIRSPSSWSWDFGDGSGSPEQNPLHTYPAAGTYTVSLKATNAGGSDTSTKKDFIHVSGSVKPPVADFYANPTSGRTPLTAKFTDTSTGSPTSWYWEFGDGTNATLRNPIHSYSTPGRYTVSLTVTNPGGSNTKTRYQYITVKVSPTPTPTKTCTPKPTPTWTTKPTPTCTIKPTTTCTKKPST